MSIVLTSDECLKVLFVSLSGKLPVNYFVTFWATLFCDLVVKSPMSVPNFGGNWSTMIGGL